MKFSRRSLILSSAGLLSMSALAGRALAFDNPMTGIDNVTEDITLASDAYIYGYPLVTMEMTRRVVTNVAHAKGTRGPMGSLIKLRQYPDATFRDVTAPNADTLYTTAFFDVGNEPWVLDQPDMGDRYFLLPMLSGWTDVFEVPGSRTTGGAKQTFLITGPGWNGTVPAGMKLLKSPTAMVWLLGRIYCTGTPEDYAAVHALQDQCRLVPLSAWGLLLANLFWVLAYDTEYAMVDRDDDLQIGIKTSAITFGRYDVLAIMLCYGAALGLFWAVGWHYGLRTWFGLGMLAAVGCALYHYSLIRDRDRAKCFAAFMHNNWLGAAMFGDILLDYSLR